MWEDVESVAIQHQSGKNSEAECGPQIADDEYDAAQDLRVRNTSSMVRDAASGISPTYKALRWVDSSR